MASPPGEARRIAFEVIERVEAHGAFADRALDGRLRRRGALDPRERALATELVYGTLRRRGTIDRCLGRQLHRPLARLDPPVLRALRLGAYQILFLDRVPDHAAVDASVELARAHGKPGTAGFVNGVLRALCRAVAREGGREALRAGAAEDDFPDWLLDLWGEDLAPAARDRVLRSLLAPPETILRVNRGKADREAVHDRLRAEGFEAEPVEGLPAGLRLVRGGDIRRASCYGEGWCVQQDAASQLVVEILDPGPGESVLDACAAPGIKTTQIAERLAGQGRVTAVDRNPGRLRDLAALCRRLGVQGVSAACADAAGRRLPFDPRLRFDRILVDPPCSGLGILRRNPERKWRAAPDLDGLAALQGKLLEGAARHLRPGGVLVYSTCTLSRRENEAVVERFLETHPAFGLESAAECLPVILRDLCSEEGYLQSWRRPEAFDLFFAARLTRGRDDGEAR